MTATCRVPGKNNRVKCPVIHCKLRENPALFAVWLTRHPTGNLVDLLVGSTAPELSASAEPESQSSVN